MKPMLRASRSGLIIVALSASLLAAADARAQAYRIMPVGDSITAGYTNNPTWTVPFGFGYRSGLYTRLTQSGLPFTFVGTSPEPFDGKFGTPQTVAAPDLRTTNNPFDANQNRHEGYGAQGTSFVSNNIASWLAIDKPDVVLLTIGINDIALGSAAAPASAKSNLNSIVQTITTQRPNANVIVAQITPYSTFTAAIVDYNTYIRDTLVPAFAAQGKHVTTVNQYSNFASGTTVDSSLYSNGINHPNAAGYDKMAQTWFAGIQSLNLPATPPFTPPNLVSNSGFETPIVAANSHSINPSATGWTFTTGAPGAGSGVDRGDPYGAGNSSSADGSQQAFLQSSGNGSVTSISQIISGLKVGQQYMLEFQAKAINGFQGANPFRVEMIGSSTTPLFGGNILTPVPASYTTYASAPFTATDATITLRFFDSGLSTVQKVTWIDAVSLTVVPEPKTAKMIGTASVIPMFCRWRPSRKPRHCYSAFRRNIPSKLRRVTL